MHEYILDNKYLYLSKTTTRGTQPKYKKNNFFYKQNKLGNEGFVEYLVSRLLKHSNLPHYAFVDYEYCKINNVLGCKSKNFLNISSEELITLETLYTRITGNTNLSNQLGVYNSAKERLDYVCKLVDRAGMYVPIFRDYLCLLCQLDMLILNTDRHWHNICLIYNNVLNRFRIAPIFDNGLSLSTDKNTFSSSCTLSGSFEDQVIAFGYPVEPYFTLDYKSIYKDLDRITKQYGLQPETLKLKEQLKQYEGLFNR